jgi:transcriptional regulator
VHGRLHIRDDEKFLRAVVGRLTRRHEAETGAARPWKMSDSAPEFIQQMIASIVGIEIEILRIEAKSKLSQNKAARDREGVVEAMQARGLSAMAKAIQAAAAPPHSTDARLAAAGGFEGGGSGPAPDSSTFDG